MPTLLANTGTRTRTTAKMFLDTSGLLCLIDKREPRQEKAVKLYDRATIRLTHNYVLEELVALGNSRGVPRGPVGIQRWVVD